MTRDDDFIAHLEGYLDEYEGSTPMPGRVRDAVRARIPSTMQRPAWWPERRYPSMNNYVRIGAAAAVLVIAAALGYGVLVAPNIGAPNLSEPNPTATPTPSPTPMPIPPDGGLDPGTYTAHPYEELGDPMSITLTVPAGWLAVGERAFMPASGSGGPDGMGIDFSRPTGLFSDPCDADYEGSPDVVVGPTVGEFADALTQQTAYEASEPVDVTLGGYPGKRIELQLPSPETVGVSSFAACRNEGFFLWDNSIYAQGPDNRWTVWVLDVEGTRVVVVAEDFAASPAADRDEMMAIVDSIAIDPAD